MTDDKLLYKLTAEGISTKAASAFINANRDKFNVVAAWMDEVSSNVMVVCSHCTRKEATALRKALWGVSGGLHCDITVTTGEAIDEYL